MWVREEYERWLPQSLAPLIAVSKSGDDVYFKVRYLKAVMLDLKLSQERSTINRQLLYIKGGLLAAAHNKGRLEFREVLNHKVVIAAIHEFRPSLPWWMYRRTQAVIHAWVMFSFGQHLKKL